MSKCNSSKIKNSAKTLSSKYSNKKEKSAAGKILVNHKNKYH